MTAVVGNRALRGPVTAVPMVGTDGVLVEANTDTNQVEVKLDETVLWEGSNASSATLSERHLNFNKIELHLRFSSSGAANVITISKTVTGTYFDVMYAAGNTYAYLCALKMLFSSDTLLTIADAKYVYSPFGTSTTVATDTQQVETFKKSLVKVVGIGRKQV